MPAMHCGPRQAEQRTDWQVKVVSVSLDVDRALELPRVQGYFRQVDVRTPLADLDACKRLLDMLRVCGWTKDLDRRVTHCGGMGRVPSYFDPARLTADLTDDLVKDEAISRWSQHEWRRAEPLWPDDGVSWFGLRFG